MNVINYYHHNIDKKMDTIKFDELNLPCGSFRR